MNIKSKCKAIFIVPLILLTACEQITMIKKNSEIPIEETYSAQITAVLEGDTVKIRFSETPSSLNRYETIHLIGVETPKLNLHTNIESEPFSEEAFWYTNNYYGQNVEIELDSNLLYDSDSYLYAYIWLSDGSLLNKKLIQEGYAYYNNDVYFNPVRMQMFENAQNVAKSQGNGVWK